MNEAACAEVRDEQRGVPREGAIENGIRFLHVVGVSYPALSRAVKPVTQAAVTPREMAELVRDDGEHLLAGKKSEQRDAEHEHAARSEQAEEAARLGRARVERIVEHHFHARRHA